MEAKSQHYLLSKQARALSVKRIVRLSDEEAFAEYVAVRFADTGGEPACIRCGSKKLYFISTRKKWKCADPDCGCHFSPTTGTPFASRKLPYRDILVAIALFAKAPKGVSAIRLSHELEVWYKTAFVLLHKIREAVGIEQHRHQLRGVVEIDGGYNGGYVRPRNNRPKRIDRRSTRYSEKRQCVTIMRERGGRSRAFIMSESDAAKLVPTVIAPGSVIVTDESPSTIDCTVSIRCVASTTTSNTRLGTVYPRIGQSRTSPGSIAPRRASITGSRATTSTSTPMR